MKRRRTYYMAVQVVERYEDGRIYKWYDGEQRASEREAVIDAKDNAEQFPDTPYQVLEVTIGECGKEIVAVPVANGKPKSKKSKAELSVVPV